MFRRPNQRQLIIRRQELGKDEIVDKILKEPDSPEAKLWPQCIDIFESRIKRGYVEACLLGSTDYAKISELLEVPVDVLELYEKTCFNIKGLDRLSKLDMLDK